MGYGRVRSIYQVEFCDALFFLDSIFLTHSSLSFTFIFLTYYVPSFLPSVRIQDRIEAFYGLAGGEVRDHG